MKKINLFKFTGMTSMIIGMNFQFLNLLHSTNNYILKSIATFPIIIGIILLSIEEVKP